jgi:four helix bundle protein
MNYERRKPSVKYQQFEELPVSKTSITLALRVFQLTSTGCVSKFSGFKNQLERAAVSISNNIAEGFERGTHEELLTFLYIARGSTGEVRSMLCLLRELLDHEDYRPEIEELRSLSLSITRQLNAWLDALKKTKSVGHRHQTVEKREALDRAKRQEDFLDYLRQALEGKAVDPDRTSGKPPPTS